MKLLLKTNETLIWTGVLTLDLFSQSDRSEHPFNPIGGLGYRQACFTARKTWEGYRAQFRRLDSCSKRRLTWVKRNWRSFSDLLVPSS